MDLFAILIYQSMLSPTQLTVATRVQLNNMIADWLISDCRFNNNPVLPPIFAETSSRIEMYAENRDWMITVAQNRNLFNNDAQLFIDHYVRYPNRVIDFTPDPDRRRRVSTLTEMPWASGNVIPEMIRYTSSNTVRGLLRD